LFKPDTHQPQARHWLNDTWLHSSDKLTQTFGEQDWSQVPKMDFASVLFKQLSTPEAAKVFDDSEGFVLETFGQPLPTPRAEKKSELAAMTQAESNTALADEQAKALPIKSPEPQEKVDPSVLYGAESFWASANPRCGNCSLTTASLMKYLIPPTGLPHVKWLTKKVLLRGAKKVLKPVNSKAMKPAT